MPSFYEKAKEVIKENQDSLSIFEELDRTGKLKKRSYKKRASFTIDEDTLIKFRQYCKKHGYNMSAKIENYMEKELNKNND